MGALAWRRVLTVSRGCTETVEALIAAAPAAAWPANTLSPSGLPPPTIAAAWKWRRRRGLGERRRRKPRPAGVIRALTKDRPMPHLAHGMNGSWPIEPNGSQDQPPHPVTLLAACRSIGRLGRADASRHRVQVFFHVWWCRRLRLDQRSNRPRRPLAAIAEVGRRLLLLLLLLPLPLRISMGQGESQPAPPAEEPSPPAVEPSPAPASSSLEALAAGMIYICCPESHVSMCLPGPVYRTS